MKNRISSTMLSKLFRARVLTRCFLVCVALVGLSSSRVLAQTYTTAFQSVGGYFVVAEDGGGSVVNCDRVAIGPWETFTLIDLNGGSLESGDLVNIQTVGGYYVVAEGGGGDVVNADRTVPLSWETFRIDKVDSGGVIGSGDAISLQASNGWSGGGGNYVVAEEGGGGVVNANRSAVGPWETFTIYIF